MQLDEIYDDAIVPALALLPVQMQRKIKRPGRVRQHSPGLTTHQPISEVRQMAESHSTDTLLAASRSKNGTPLFDNPCPDCGKQRLSDRRRLGKPCMDCAPKRRITHGLCGHRLFKLLMSVRARCEHHSATHYRYYGGRGIKVCDEWRTSPAAFVAWAQSNGYQPGLELDRKDNDGPYAPWNCQFITRLANSRKRSNAKCDLRLAALVKKALQAGLSVGDAAASAGVPKMVAWHISKGNTWRDA